MKDIYQSAAIVRVWVSNDNEVGQLLRMFLFRLVANYDEDVAIEKVWRTAVRELLSFYRKWILQEIVLAREAVVHWGAFKLPWSNLPDSSLLENVGLKAS